MDAIITNSTEQLLKLNETLRKYNISLSVLIFVACVENNESLKLTEIGEKLGITSAGMTTIRDSAIDRLFVEETKTEDRRAKFYQITDLGIELLASCRQ